MALALKIDEVRTTADVVAENIRAEAARMGLTQLDVARALGMSQTQVTTRWRGVAQWRLDELDAVAAFFGLSVADLVEDKLNPAGGSHRRGLLRARRDSNPQPSDP